MNFNFQRIVRAPSISSFLGRLRYRSREIACMYATNSANENRIQAVDLIRRSDGTNMIHMSYIVGLGRIYIICDVQE